MMSLVRRLVCLVLTGCALPTTIGQVPSDDTGSASVSSTVGTSTVGVATSTGFPPPTATSTALPTGDGSSDTGMVGPGPVRSFSIRYGDIPPQGGTDTASDVGGTTGGPDPDALLVVITTGDADCVEPFGMLQCGGAWQIEFALPPALQVPGTYDLFADLAATASETIGPGPDCGFGGGTFEGTVDLTVVSADLVAGQISADDMQFDFDPNVAFEAERCP
jgi:hypothetical protein